MSTIGSLMLALGQGGPAPYGDILAQTASTRGRELGNETALLQLADLKRSQASEQEVLAFFQQHPELIAGLQQGPLGGQVPTLATLGQPPGAPTVIPGGQDLSRYANVPPTGGGPIPPNVAQQMQPTVTPPPGMPSVAGVGQPQGPMPAPQNPLMELVRRDPRAGLLAQQQMQGQEDLALKREEQRLTIGTQVAEYVGRVAQGVTSPETLEQARQELARIHPQAAAQLPQTYSKEAMLPFIKKAVSVKDNATLQLETWKNQIEMQKAGLQGEPAAMVSELRTMGVNPLQATTEQRQQAQKNIQQRELAKEGEAQRLKFEQEQEQQKNLPLQDARKEDAGLFVYKGTGQTVPGTLPYGQTKQLQDEKDPEKGVIKLANLDEKKQLTTLKQLEPVLQQYADLVQYAYGTDEKTGKKGPLADYDRSPSTVIDAMYGQLEQTDPVFQAKRRALQGQLQSVVRGLGARGDLNAQELEAAQQMIANMDASMGLGLNLGVGVGSGGAGPMIGVKPTISIPDTPRTGVAIANELIGTVNRRIGSILQHEGYSKTPTITLYTGTPPAGTSATPPTAKAPTPTTPAPAAKPKGRQPGEIPVLGGPGMPEQYLPAPGKQSQAAPAPTAAPVTPAAPAPPTARSTPAQDEAYRQSQGQGRPPAPAAPSRRPTPGRQSQARPGASAVRVAGAPKYMELADVAEAVRQTGRSRTEVEKAARARGFIVYGSKLPLPEVTMVG